MGLGVGRLEIKINYIDRMIRKNGAGLSFLVLMWLLINYSNIFMVKRGQGDDSYFPNYFANIIKKNLTMLEVVISVCMNTQL